MSYKTTSYDKIRRCRSCNTVISRESKSDFCYHPKCKKDESIVKVFTSRQWTWAEIDEIKTEIVRLKLTVTESMGLCDISQ